MGAKEQLLKFKKQIDRELLKYYKSKIAEAKKISPSSVELIEGVADLTMRGGKRIRAALLYQSYLAYGGKEVEKIMRAAMAMELLQTFLLVHDDIIDNSKTRRGGPTSHKHFEKISKTIYKEKAKANFFGISSAILCGDIAAALCNELIAESGFEPKRINAALLELNKTISAEIYGEYLDITSELRKDVSKEEIVLIHALKTSPYTFNCPIKIGAILAGASDLEIAKIPNYGTPLGIAFQIQDDILGMFGSAEKLGKPVISDLAEGKKTLLILDALEHANSAQKKIINSALGKDSITYKNLLEVRKIIKATGAYDKSVKLAYDYVQKSLGGLLKLDISDDGRTFFAGIAGHMVKREY